MSTVARYSLAEYALIAACASLLAAEHCRAAAFTSAHQYMLVQTSLVAAIGALLVMHHPRREVSPLYLAMLAYVSRFAIREQFQLVSPASLLTIAAAGVALTLVLVLVFPWPDVSELHGEYKALGVTVGRFGGIECRVLYPSGKTPSTVPLRERASMLHHGEHSLKGMSVFSGVPQWLFGCLRAGYLAAVPNAPVAAPPSTTERWPVVVFSHGLGGCIDIYSALTQQLASEGNVVVVVNHCDGSAAVTRHAPDNRVAYYTPISPAVRDNVNGAGFAFRNKQLQQRVAEVRRVLDAIALEHAEQRDGNVFAVADMARVSLVGHSFGAATAMTTAHVDDRVRAVVLLDAWMEPVDEDAKRGLGARVPVFHLLSEHFAKWDVNMRDTTAHTQGSTHAQTKLTVLMGSRHNNFCDLPVFSPLVNRIMKSAGSIDPKYALRAMSRLSAAFLRGSYTAVRAQFPEVLEIDVSAVATS